MKEFVITETESPTYGGRSFGSVGQYERLTGYAVGAVDPGDARNAGIVNIDKAPRNADGHVEYKADICILRPVDPAKANGWLFYEVLNRGSKRAVCRVNSAPATNSSSDADDAGTGFLMEEGYTILWSGWQDDVKDGDGRMRAHYPTATDGGTPITGLTLDETIDESNSKRIAKELIYPVATLDKEAATLTARVRERDTRQQPAGLDWRYIDDTHIEITRPDDPVFDAGTIFEFIYTAKNPRVTGLAFASHRDIADFLRGGAPDASGNANPMASAPLRRCTLFGISQSGRFVRDFLYQGFNQSVTGGRVFDAAVPVIAGSRKTQINMAFAQPGRYQRQHEDHSYPGDQFPFAYRELTDPISGLTDNLLARCEATGTTPKIMHFDTETEIWSARASLVVTDCEGNDIDQPDNVRVYLASGIPHGWAIPPNGTAMQMPDNELCYGALIRPLLVALQDWVENDTPPPASCFPSVAMGTLVTPGEAGFPVIPGFAFEGTINGLCLMDYSSIPPAEGAAYPVLVSTVDGDGNATAGLRHPVLRVPRATLLGWNLRARGYSEGDIYSSIGGKIPFADTRAERLSRDDPRASIEERYPNNAGYAARMREETSAMVAEGLLLPEDADRIVAAAEAGENVLTAA
jgi:hypothetical protein